MEDRGNQLLTTHTTPSIQPEQIQNPKQAGSYFIKYRVALIILGFFVLLGIIYVVSFSHTNTAQNQKASQSQINSNTPKQAFQGQVIYTESQLAQLTGSPRNLTKLPLGDNKYTLSGPKKGSIYLCNLQQGGGGAQGEGSWIHGITWNLTEKPAVRGVASWPSATFSNTISGSSRIITGNDLPLNTTTGIFPIQSTDPAFDYDRNPNKITSHSFTLTLPVSPQATETPSCMGGEVGVMLNGVPLFNGFDAEYRDAAAHEVQDSCDGHPQENGEYHYHSLSSCIKDIHETTVIGFALDGFPITGPLLANGTYLTTNDLDACHGMTSEIMLDGKITTMYHYVMTEDFPYSVSCFRGKPVSMQVIRSQQGRSAAGGGQGGLQNGTTPQPPQEAFTVCSGKSAGTSCSFTAPRGTVTGTCQMPPGQTSLVCGPSQSPVTIIHT